MGVLPPTLSWILCLPWLLLWLWCDTRWPSYSNGSFLVVWSNLEVVPIGSRGGRCKVVMLIRTIIFVDPTTTTPCEISPLLIWPWQNHRPLFLARGLASSLQLPPIKSLVTQPRDHLPSSIHPFPYNNAQSLLLRPHHYHQLLLQIGLLNQMSMLFSTATIIYHQTKTPPFISKIAYILLRYLLLLLHPRLLSPLLYRLLINCINQLQKLYKQNYILVCWWHVIPKVKKDYVLQWTA